MGVTFIAPAEQFTSPAKLITKEITEDGTYYAADDNANGYSSVEVSVGGGGGGDFSTADVIVTNNNNETVKIFAPLIYGTEYAGSDGQIYAEKNDSGTWHIILYKGVAYCTIAGSISLNKYTVSGDITRTGSTLEITGSGTITVVA